MFTDPTPGILSGSTKTAYAARAQSMISRFERETGNTLSSTSTPIFARWLYERRDRVTPASWRQYRAALVWTLRAAGYEEIATATQQIGTEGCRARTATPVNERKTSAKKQKTLNATDRQALHEALMSSRSEFAGAVRLMLEAGRIAGLRPTEWRTAKVIHRGDLTLLRVRNGKASHGRAHGEYRTLDLTHLNTNEITVVRSMVELAHDQQGNWDGFYRNCQAQLGRTTRRLWPSRAKRPTLYSGRHQFAADAKASGLTRIEVAALMGHGTDRTAGAHYGRKRHGSRGFRVSASAEDMGNVREVSAAQAAPKQRGAGPAPK